MYYKLIVSTQVIFIMDTSQS